MAFDDVVLRLQRGVDRLIRRARLGRSPQSDGPRLLVVQIDGLSAAVLDQALAERRMPFLARLLADGGWRRHPMAVGLPSSTPAFQLAAMYGVRPDIPGFHYHDKRRGADVYFPRGGDAALVEREQAAGRRGILAGGCSFGCVFTGGAVDNLFSFAMLKRPSGAGVVRVVSAFIVLAWVVLKSTALTLVEVARAVLRFVADPVGESARGWKWLAIKVGLSVWVRQLFTLAASRNLYAGAPAVYVNFLDYDVFAHAYGPRHRRALRALRRVDRSIHQLWRVLRRVPQHRYQLYVLSDHGQVHCVPYRALAGRPIERRLFEDFFAPGEVHAVTPETSRGRRLARGIKAYRSGRAPGFFQRFINYLEDDFPWVLGEARQARERDGVRVIAAGPNAFVYFLAEPDPLPLEWIDRRFPGLAEEISRSRGVGFVLARGAGGPVCVWRGKRYRLDELGDGPFAGRDDLALVAAGIADLMGMRCAGDLVLYGEASADGNVSYVAEVGAHAGPAPEELHTFIVAPAGAPLPASITHPVQLYDVFIRYQRGGRPAA
jgi:hypothetical protein